MNKDNIIALAIVACFLGCCLGWFYFGYRLGFQDGKEVMFQTVVQIAHNNEAKNSSK